jgi:RHS repeat-associated protein
VPSTSWSHTYTCDKSGNRTGKDSITYTINSVNEVTALSDGTSFSYDDNGNRTQKAKGNDTWDYNYDYANRLTKVEENDSTIGEYVYDGDGKRLQKTENSITTTYIHSSINPMYEENSTGSACYVYGPTGLITKRTTINQHSHTYFYHKDHLGSTRSMTDSSKNIIAASTYHPFGETEVEEGSEQYLFNGKEKDSTGLYYYGARYYDPEIGRFMTRDLIRRVLGNSQILNRYIYCLNNPIKYIDPDGLIEKNHAIDGNVGTGFKPPKPQPPAEPKLISSGNPGKDVELNEEILKNYNKEMEKYERDLAIWLEFYGTGTVFGEDCECSLSALPEDNPLPPLPEGPYSTIEIIEDWYKDEKSKDAVNDYTYTLWFISLTFAVLYEAASGDYDPTKSGGNPEHVIC